MLSFATLRPIQAMAATQFFQSRRLMLCLPRQFGGKTELGVRLTEDLLSTVPGIQALFLAKSKTAAKKAVREKHMRIFDPALFQVNTELVYQRKSPTTACFVDSVDKDPDRIRGGTFGLVHWSEVAFSRIEHGHTIRDVFDKVIQPTLAIRDGYTILESTNNGMNGWYDLWNAADEFGFTRLRVTFSQMVEMGLVPRETYDKIKSTTQTDVFRQEWECEWVSFAGKVYNEFDPNRHIDSNIANPESWQAVVAGIDWGFNDATCVLFAYVRDGKVYIFDEIYEQEKLLDEIYQTWQAKTAQWEYDTIAAVADHDPARIKELERRGIPCAKAQKADTLGNRLQVKEKFFKNEIFIHPRCKYLIKDLTTATWDTKKLNDIDYGQCTYGHFDAEAALRYLLRELEHFEKPKPEVNPHEDDNISAAAWEMMRKRREAYGS